MMLVVLLLFAVGVSRSDGVPFSTTGTVAVVGWAVVFLPIGGFRWLPPNRIQDDRLTIRGSSYRGCYLPEVEFATVHRWRPPMGKVGYLVLTINTTIDIRLADSLWSRCYFRPEDLLALADSLAKSPHPEPRAAAAWLRRFAADPTAQPWPS
jgi:hypothetical protein